MNQRIFLVAILVLGIAISLAAFTPEPDWPQPYAAIGPVLFWIGVIGLFMTAPSKSKVKQEKLEERLRELEIQNKIAEAEERIANRKRDA